MEELNLFFDERLPTRGFAKAMKGNHGIQDYVIEGQHKDLELTDDKEARETTKDDPKI